MSTEKMIRDYSCSEASNILAGSNPLVGTEGFELKPDLISMVHGSPCCGKAMEDANAHLQPFMEVCSTFIVKGISQDAIRICLFSFSLVGKAKQWFYKGC